MFGFGNSDCKDSLERAQRELVDAYGRIENLEEIIKELRSERSKRSVSPKTSDRDVHSSRSDDGIDPALVVAAAMVMDDSSSSSSDSSSSSYSSSSSSYSSSDSSSSSSDSSSSGGGGD